ncbi:MAG: CYTH domain-containing protein [Bacilli bacterium]|nr:CYTH domain-containing protein [Bacilli bacterium]
MSSNNIEIEAKVLLSKENYDRLVKELRFPTVSLVQTNYYLDSRTQVLKKYGMILRIRESGQKFVFTLKAPLSEGLLEKNQALTREQAEDLIDRNIFPKGDIRNFLDILQINAEELLVLATLTTFRKETEYKDSVLDISQNSYGDHLDYELECDSDSAIHSQEILKEVCEKYGIEYSLNTLSKEDRAITAALNK